MKSITGTTPRQSKALGAIGLAACVLVASGGCALDTSAPESDDEGTEAPAAATDPASVFHVRTSVTLYDDGSYSVSTSKVSLAQQLAEREAEEAGHPEWAGLIDDRQGSSNSSLPKTLVEDDACSYVASLRQWSKTSYTGDELCLRYTGSAALHSWREARPLGYCYWGAMRTSECSIPVKSFKTGANSVIYGQDSSFTCGASSPTYPASTNVSSAGTWVRAAHYVGREVSCTPT